MMSDDSDVSTSGDDEDCSIDKSSSFDYVLFDKNIFINLINSIGKCEKCGCSVNRIHQLQEKRGFCHSFKIVCVNSNCKWFKYCLTSEELKKDEVTRGRKMYDVNTRAVIAYREIGKGHAAMETVNGYINMPPPMTIRAYNYIVKNVLRDRYVKCAKDSMQDAALEIRRDILREDEKVVDVDISADGIIKRCCHYY